MEENEVLSLKGTVESITFQNDVNGYTVCNVKTENENITVVGILPFLHTGESAEFFGKYIFHQVYGKQFSATSFNRIAPENTAAILRYLSSGVIKGIGPSTANKIVSRFGEQSLDIIQNKPAELASIKGISIDKAYAISEEYAKQYSVRDIMLMLAPFNVSPELSVKIFRSLKEDATEIIKKNPYVLCSDDIGVSFEKAEEIAENFGIAEDNGDRLSAGIMYVLRKNLLNGHTCLPRVKLAEVSARLLGTSVEIIDDIISTLVSLMQLSRVTLEGEEFLALSEYYCAEEYISARLSSIKKTAPNMIKIADLEIDRVENKLGIKFEELQRNAIKEAFDNGILILTGGPGTGKTTTLNAIIELFENRGSVIELAAPTGRAAKRMSELTGRPAKTIHRMLEVEWGENEKQKFGRNERNPLDCEVLVVDEVSMVDALLFESLLRAIKPSCRLILVGDTDQLPSISAGNILSDILASGVFPAIRLKKVFRQAGKSLIITNAHAIIDGDKPNLDAKDSDFFFINKFSADDICDTVRELCRERLPKAYGFNPLTDIQVLCPSRKFETGTATFNTLLQSALNPNIETSQRINYKGYSMYNGDKVMQTKNNYDLPWVDDNGQSGTGVFNGDIGFIEKIDLRAGIVNIRYDDKVATYYTENLSEIELAYAVTVHKSQGSEYDCVILPLFEVVHQLKYRNLLYTAVTRAKKLLIIVGSRSDFFEMQTNNKKTLRYTMLKTFLEEKNYEREI